MSGPFETQMTIGVKDNASAGIQRIRNETQRMQEARERLGVRSENTIRRAIQQTEAAMNRMARSGTLSASELSRAQEKAAAKISSLQKEMAEAEVRSYTRRNAAREAWAALGIRSEHSIRREIQQTEAAYGRLERSGVLSAQELQRAQEKNIATVARLRRELGETAKQERTLGERFRGGAAVAGKIGGAVFGAGLLLRGPINDASAYDATLRREANFAYSDRDVKGRQAGMKRISDAVRDAVDKTGASPEEAFSALETMWRSGVMGKEKPYQYLNNVLRNAAATGSDAESVANTQASAVNFGLSDKDAPAALSVLTTMAQHGRIDVPALAHEMPRGLESGKSAGFHGQRGFAQLAAFFEASSIGAKDPLDATTNANDFLAELTANNLQTSAERIRINGHKLDIRGMMRYDLAHGRTALDTVTGVIGKMDESDPAYRRLKKQLTGATTDQQREQLSAQITQIHGQHISQLFPNQQARNAYINFDRNRDFFNAQVSEGVDQFNRPDGQRSADQDWKLVSDGPQWKQDREKHMAVVTSNDTMKGAAGVWGDFMNHVADLEAKFPALATAVSSTTSAFQSIQNSGLGSILGGALGAGIFKKIFGRGGAAVADEAGAEAAGAAGGAGGGSLLGGSGRWLVGGLRSAGGSVVTGGKGLVTDGILGEGLLSNPLALAVTSMVYSPGTVSGGDESAELTRLKNQNYGKNSRQTSAQALNLLQRHPGRHAPAGGPVINLPPQPAPVVNVHMYVDGQQMASWLHAQIEYSARRHGA
ncbi:phage tail tape measure protein [Pantoea rodasii]|uniref:Phage tail tape measure protein n=1 Tax=Pantoea rodasii TaxID=1076549 RepID=A0A2M9WHJ1_9GAMM|nr:phage tail tape measure protein [Pantoea rodasii]ORM59596.1 hypothetical protein HA45_22520 [Pantoea rodasii]PJZ07014.1 phage tail tape measure protein [Pantoea rodasii]